MTQEFTELYEFLTTIQDSLEEISREETPQGRRFFTDILHNKIEEVKNQMQEGE